MKIRISVVVACERLDLQENFLKMQHTPVGKKDPCNISKILEIGTRKTKQNKKIYFEMNGANPKKLNMRQPSWRYDCIESELNVEKLRVRLMENWFYKEKFIF